MLVVALLIVLPTAVAGLVTHRRAQAAMEDGLVHQATAVTHNAALLLGTHMRLSPGETVEQALDQLMQDQHLAFLVVREPSGRVRHQRYNDALAWRSYADTLTPAQRESPLTLNRSIEINQPDGSSLVVRRQIITPSINPAAVAAPAATTDAPPATADLGASLLTLEMGFHDPMQLPLRTDLQDATLALIAALCLIALPLAFWQVRSWTHPLRKMIAATQRLNLGEPFEPVPVKGEDEIALLARSFNTMGANLSRVRESLTAAAAHLEQQVADRTKQLERTNARLQQEIDEKDEFLRAVSHDLGAPLRNIGGLTALLMLKHRDQVSKDVLAKLERISANVQIENELLTDLLQISRIRARKVRFQTIDLHRLLKTLAQTMSYDLQTARISLTFARRFPTLYADRTRIRQVFQNLIDNAIKYMPADAEPRQIHVGCRLDGDGEVFFVRDTGAGLAEADQEAVFQVFRRARYSGGHEVPGRGVGLATVKAIVECHGGRIWVESKPGEGATFCFTVDACHLKPADPPPFTAPRPAATPADAASAVRPMQQT